MEILDITYPCCGDSYYPRFGELSVESFEECERKHLEEHPECIRSNESK